MVFDIITSEKKFFNFHHPKTYTYLGLGIGMISGFTLSINKNYLGFNFIEIIFYPITIISLLIFIITSFFTLFSKEDIKINKIGKLKITSNEFIINKEEISFNKIISIELSVYDYEGRSKDTHSSIKPMYSLGIENYI